MLLNPMLQTRYLLPFYTLSSLQYAFAYVVQLPDIIAQSTQILTLATYNSATAPSLNGTTTNLHQEEPPLPFKVEYLWKEGGKTFDRLAFCNTLIEDMGVLIPESWDEELAGIQFEADYKIRIGFVKDRSGPGPKTKHIVWALERLFNIIVERNRYSTGTIIVNSNWDTGRLALGTLTVVDSSLVLVNTTNRLPDSLSSSPLEGSTVSTAMTDSNDTVPFPNLQLPNHTQGKSTTVQTSSANRTLTTDGDVHLILLYRQSGATFHDVQVYNASLQLLVRIAEVENQQAFIWPVLSTYNDMDDFTLSIRPLEFAKRSELSWQDTSLVLTDLAVQMSEEEPGAGLPIVRTVRPNDWNVPD